MVRSARALSWGLLQVRVAKFAAALAALTLLGLHAAVPASAQESFAKGWGWAGSEPVDEFDTAASSSAAPHCSTAQLRLMFVDAQAALGRRYIDYAFKNAGASSCSLRGYPTGLLLDKQGHVIGSAHAKVAHFSASPIRTVVIGSGKRGFFTFVWGDGAFCPGRAFTFYGLQVSPPNNAIGFRRGLGKTSACDARAAVSAVRPKRLPF